LSVAYYLVGIAELTADERRIFPLGGHVATAEEMAVMQHLEVVRLGWQATYKIKDWPFEDYIPPPLRAVLLLLQDEGAPVTVTPALIDQVLAQLAQPAPPGFLDPPEPVEAFLHRHLNQEISYFSI
jgi:hypothetical protein